MRRHKFGAMHCSLARGLDKIGDWWSPLIVRDLFVGIARFDDLVEDLGISRNLLTRRLAALQKAGVVERTLYSHRPKRYAYRLTECGRDLVPALLALTAWGDRWAPPAAGSPILFVHSDCRNRFTPQVTCSMCGGRLDAEHVHPLPGPGGAAKAGTKIIARLMEAAARAPSSAAARRR